MPTRSITIPEDVSIWLNSRAASRRRTISFLIREALEFYEANEGTVLAWLAERDALMSSLKAAIHEAGDRSDAGEGTPLPDLLPYEKAVKQTVQRQEDYLADQMRVPDERKHPERRTVEPRFKKGQS